MTHERNDGKSNLKDEARTPTELFRKLDKKYHFECDAAATSKNALCKWYLGENYARQEEDSTKIDWCKTMFQDESTQNYCTRFYCNPPYSNPTPFIRKAYEESLKGATVVMLLPADTSTKSFYDYCMKADEIIFLKGRVVFNNPDGTPMQGSPKFGSMVVVFDWMQYQPKRVQVRSWDWRNEEL